MAKEGDHRPVHRGTRLRDTRDDDVSALARKTEQLFEAGQDKPLREFVKLGEVRLAEARILSLVKTASSNSRTIWNDRGRPCSMRSWRPSKMG